MAVFFRTGNRRILSHKTEPRQEQRNRKTEIRSFSAEATRLPFPRKPGSSLKNCFWKNRKNSADRNRKISRRPTLRLWAARNTGRNEASGQSSAAPAGASGGSGGGLFQLRFQRRKHRSADSAGRGTSPDHRVQFAAGKHQEQSDGYASVSACRTAAAAESGSNGRPSP